MPENLPDPDLIRRWLEGNLRDEDAAQIESLGEMKEWADAAARLQPLPVMSKETAWEALEMRMENQQATARLSPSARTYALRRPVFISLVAAAVALLVGVYFLLPDPASPHTIHAASGTHISQNLPDGSTVILNAQSILSFDPRKWDQGRDISLDGEAYFIVQPGSTFSVKTAGAEIRVLGTEFNVFARDRHIDVACFSGKVEVSAAGDRVLLGPGDAAQADETGRMKTYAFDLKGKAAWKKGEFYFDKVPLKFVLEELERQFDVVVLMPSNDERIYTGFFTNQDLNAALEMICLPMGLNHTFEGKTRIRLSE